ncbi:MAG: rhodanese-like domain-containing protein [Oscillospiraceae bacterium]|nr:rhodanese-like domain-containing protein [Oscillospiraceae bacterium]
MGFMDFLSGSDINKAVEEYRATPGAVLLDIRDKDEYAEGRIPGSVNIPLNSLGLVSDRIPRKDTPLFVYCLSGARSSRAVQFLQKNGYTAVKNIGGINRYRGELER